MCNRNRSLEELYCEFTQKCVHKQNYRAMYQIYTIDSQVNDLHLKKLKFVQNFKNSFVIFARDNILAVVLMRF